jgi:hypothetical protein
MREDFMFWEGRFSCPLPRIKPLEFRVVSEKSD